MAAAANGTAAAEVQPDGNATPERDHPAMAAFSLPPPAAHATGKVDEVTFAEAMSVVDDLASAVYDGPGSMPDTQLFPAVDKFDEQLFDHLDAIEAEDSVSAMNLYEAPSSQGTSMSDSTDTLPSFPIGDTPLANGQVDGSLAGSSLPAAGSSLTASGDGLVHSSAAADGQEQKAHPGVTQSSSGFVRSSSSRREVSHDDEKDACCKRTWKALKRALHELARGAWKESLGLLLLLAPVVLTLITTDDDARDAAAAASPALEVLGTHWLALRLAIVFLLARLTSVALVNVILWLANRLPGLVLLVVHSFRGWPLTTLIWGAYLVAIFSTRHFDSAAWAELQREERRFWPVCIWLLCGALTRGVWESVLQSWLDQLTLRHFEQRTKVAYTAHKALRRIAAAARIVERREAQEKQQAAKQRPSVTAAAMSRAAVNAMGAVKAMGMTQVPVPGHVRKPSGGSTTPAASATKALPSATAAPPKPAPPKPAASLATGTPPAAPSTAAPPTTAPPTAAPPIEAQLSADHSARKKPRSRWGMLTSQLTRLSGPFELGSGFADAPTVTQARKRAIRVFNILARQQQLCAPSSSPATAPAQARTPRGMSTLTHTPSKTLQRDKLLQWAFQLHGLQDLAALSAANEAARSLPMLNETIDVDNFVGVVERCYKEQRLLTASVESFSRTHQLLRHMCIVLWAGCFFAFGFFAWGVELATWVIPSASALLSVVVFLGRVPSDFAAGATYTLLVRPYDIGDRVTISASGTDPTMYSLVVKHIDLMRTHFITSNGQTLVMQNHEVRSLSVVNLNRSGPTTLLVLLQVPSATPSAKMTELVDSIRTYVAEKDGEWSNVDLMFSRIDFKNGYVELQVWAESVFPAHEVVSIYSARSRLLLFVHAYMQTANIEYTMPVLPIRNTTGALSL